MFRYPSWQHDILAEGREPAVRRRLLRERPESTSLVVESWRENPGVTEEREALPEVVIDRDATLGAWPEPASWPHTLEPRPR